MWRTGQFLYEEEKDDSIFDNGSSGLKGRRFFQSVLLCKSFPASGAEAHTGTLSPSFDRGGRRTLAQNRGKNLLVLGNTAACRSNAAPDSQYLGSIGGSGSFPGGAVLRLRSSGQEQFKIQETIKDSGIV